MGMLRARAGIPRFTAPKQFNPPVVISGPSSVTSGTTGHQYTRTDAVDGTGFYGPFSYGWYLSRVSEGGDSLLAEDSGDFFTGDGTSATYDVPNKVYGANQSATISVDVVGRNAPPGNLGFSVRRTATYNVDVLAHNHLEVSAGVPSFTWTPPVVESVSGTVSLSLGADAAAVRVAKVRGEISLGLGADADAKRIAGASGDVDLDLRTLASIHRLARARGSVSLDLGADAAALVRSPVLISGTVSLNLGANARVRDEIGVRGSVSLDLGANASAHRLSRVSGSVELDLGANQEEVETAVKLDLGASVSAIRKVRAFGSVSLNLGARVDSGILEGSMADIRDWNRIASGNNRSAPDGFPERMSPSGLNNSAREVMAAVARAYQTVGGEVETAGTGDTYTISYGEQLTEYIVGRPFSMKVDRNNSGPATGDINNLGPKQFVTVDGFALSEDDFVAGTGHVFIYDGAFLRVLTLVSDTNFYLANVSGSLIELADDDEFVVSDVSETDSPNRRITRSNLRADFDIPDPFKVSNVSESLTELADDDEIAVADVSETDSPNKKITKANLRSDLDIPEAFKVTDVSDSLIELADDDEIVVSDVSETDSPNKKITKSNLKTDLTSGVASIVFIPAADVGGTGDAITIANLDSFAQDKEYVFKAKAANTGAVTIDGTSALRSDGDAFEGGEIEADTRVTMTYDGTSLLTSIGIREKFITKSAYDALTTEPGGVKYYTRES